MTTEARPRVTIAADALTALRAVLALPIAAVVWQGGADYAGLLLSVSWVTDFFDGRLARRGGGGRLGDFDLPADSTVGAGLLVGLIGGGHMTPWLALPAVILAVAYLLRYNPSFAMAFLGIAYAAILWWLFRNAGWGVATVVGTIAVIAVLDWGRFIRLILPTFFGGLRPSRLTARFTLDRD